MSADVVCMSLANVPPGEQRSRFLAVGLADNTVRIISLDPSVRTSGPPERTVLHVFVAIFIQWQNSIQSRKGKLYLG